MWGWGTDIGVDLGTASILIYLRGKGIVLREPSVVALERDTQRLIAVGEEARRMLGRTPDYIATVRPLREGVIADYEITQRMLRHLLKKVGGFHLFFRPRLMVCVPSGITNVEERAVKQAALQAGAKEAYLIEEPLAAALGVGLDISRPEGSMVVDIGGGTTDIAVLSLGGIVYSRSLRVGGDKFDAAIVQYIRRRHNLLIGEQTAEEVKIEVGTVYPGVRDAAATIRGRDLVTGLPKTVEITSAELREAMREPTEAVISAIKEVLEQTPPELAADIVDRGIVMTGGGSLLHGLDLLLQEETGLPVHLADDPISSVALGAGKALTMLGVLRANHAVSGGQY
ncbi:MAG: rod shape-determining protein MreB [Clostridia bacterium]|nr:rod shape-determining protein MreB [Clostridia bacterium]MDH7572019.1 rod shape-determining protein MreB [Clostridia bacterium]